MPTTTSEQIVAELTRRGYKIDPSTKSVGVFFDAGGGSGAFRSYAVEVVNDTWSINQKAVQFVDGEDEEEESDLGSFDSAVEIADAIDEAEKEY